MKKALGLILGLLTVAAFAASDGPVSAPLVMFKRYTFESMVWDEGRVELGKESLTGYLQGLGAPGDSLIAYELEDQWDLLESLIGYPKSSAPGKEARFEVVADGKTIYTSEPIKSGGEEPELIKVPIKGAKMIILRIHPVKYGSTSGATWGGPKLMKGLKPEDLVPPLTVDVNGQRTSILQPGGKPPKEYFIPIPLSPGTTEYKVKVVMDKANNKATITTEKMP